MPATAPLQSHLQPPRSRRLHDLHQHRAAVSGIDPIVAKTPSLESIELAPRALSFVLCAFLASPVFCQQRDYVSAEYERAWLTETAWRSEIGADGGTKVTLHWNVGARYQKERFRTRQFQLASSQMDLIDEAICDSDFFDLKESYATGADDPVFAVVSVVRGERRHTVRFEIPWSEHCSSDLTRFSLLWNRLVAYSSAGLEEPPEGWKIQCGDS